MGNSIGLPGGDSCAVNETAFRYLKLIQEIEGFSYDSVVDFFAAQAGQIYTPPLKPKKSFMYQWHKKNKGNKLKKAAENVQKTDTDSKSVIDTIKHEYKYTFWDIDRTVAFYMYVLIRAMSTVDATQSIVSLLCN